jgi:tetraacyldisaccharide-1-P 4'-kinase
VSGIAKPQSFENSLAAYGSEIVARHRQGDHQGKSRDVWKWIARNRKEGAWPVMTEKDAVRWVTPDVPRELLGNAYALRMELVLSSGREIWHKMVRRLAAHVG